jgi:REP element-mobilizing transposase RayT
MTRPHRTLIRLPLAVYAETGRVFSVTIGTHPRAPVFSDMPFGLECVGCLRRLADERNCLVYAYCLMPDHVHLLVGVSPESPLPAFVQAWKSLCYRVRRSRGDRSTFWQRGFWDHAMRSDEDLRAAALYILNNPVRKGLADDRGHYTLCGSLVWDLGHDGAVS